ncbi:MAG: hypothetical protein JO323_22960 [Acidobacteriia bacterium]|nr:hypothetical protein [Terriglobia bacterium]
MRSALLLVCLVCPAWSVAAPLNRVVLALYDSHYQKDVRDTPIHRLLEMPLNHLGLVVQYHDLSEGLPTAQELSGVRGIVTWFQSDSMEDPARFLTWASAAIDAGKRFVVLGDLSVGRSRRGDVTDIKLVQGFLAKLGLQAVQWTPVTYDVKIVFQDPALMNFERPLPAVLPPYDGVKVIAPGIRVHLMARKRGDPNTDSALVVTGPHGGYVAKGYTHFANFSQDRLQWYLNPFEFLRLAFATDELPKPDTTTFNGRRIYYSHIDGDGWRNQTQVARYQRERISSAEVILREVIRPFSDLPVTVAPIAADLDPRWLGTRDSLQVAKTILKLPWVEAGSHTYSHPLDWESLAQYAKAGSAKTQSWGVMWWTQFGRPLWERFAEQWSKPEAGESSPTIRRGHSRLRSYESYPFDANEEIAGSIDFINSLLPPGKRVQLLQWSGTTLESEAILAATRKAGVRNLNGGDSRFDPEFDSYAWVAPLGRQVGRYHQVYSSDSNENTYTNLWNERYFGFRYLLETVRRTESPIRVKPFNVYYHMFSGEKEPSLDAVIANLTFARSQQLAPITASHYAAIVEGFFSLTMTPLGPNRWRIANRDALNTIRFDHAGDLGVDWVHSTGVLGQRYYQGSLYIALDPAAAQPVLAIRDGSRQDLGCRPYLVQSRWLISRLKIAGQSFSFETQGFGRGDMEWQVAPGARYSFRVTPVNGRSFEIRAAATTEGTLHLQIPESLSGPVEVSATSEGARL